MHSLRTGPRGAVQFAFLLCFSASAGGQAVRWFEAGGAFLYGPVDGTLQTPSGGEPRTTSSARPTLDELGIDRAATGKFWAGLRWKQNGLVVDGHWIRLSGDATLDTALVSQGKTFPAGAAVEADVRLDWYRLRYRRHMSLESGGKTVEVCPSVGVVLLPFHYQLSSPGVEDVDRSYSKAGLQAGIGMSLALRENWSLSAGAALPIPFSNSVHLLSTELQVGYEFCTRKDRSITGLLGIHFERIRYEDNQEVPNDVEVDLGPMLFAGLHARF